MEIKMITQAQFVATRGAFWSPDKRIWTRWGISWILRASGTSSQIRPIDQAAVSWTWTEESDNISNKTGNAWVISPFKFSGLGPSMIEPWVISFRQAFGKKKKRKEKPKAITAASRNFQSGFFIFVSTKGSTCWVISSWTQLAISDRQVEEALATFHSSSSSSSSCFCYSKFGKFEWKRRKTRKETKGKEEKRRETGTCLVRRKVKTGTVCGSAILVKWKLRSSGFDPIFSDC